MPTYEYRCAEGHRFELVQRMSEEPGAICPECGAAAERLLSAGAGFLFKGEGFYITDYRSEDYRKAAKADEGAGKGGDTKKGDAPSPSAGSGEKPTEKTSGSADAASGSGTAKKPSGTGGSSKAGPASPPPSSD